MAALFFLAEWALMFGMWLLLVGNLRRAEMLLGLGAALLSAAAAAVAQAANCARFAPHLADMAQGWRIPWYVIKGTWEIFLVLVRHLFVTTARSLVGSVSFDPGGDDAHSAGRRALAVVMMTVPPNTIAIGIDRKKHALILHEFRRGAVPIMALKLGARA